MTMPAQRPVIALIGFGHHITKNILPRFTPDAAWQLGPVYVRDVARYRAAHPGIAFTDNLADLYAAEIIYVATPIASHNAYVTAALDSGRHVWCEKAMTGSAARTRALCDHAARADRFLAEVTVYRYHRQYATLCDIIAQRRAAGSRILSADLRLTIPARADDDIRYRADLDGGALLDVGYYPLSAALALFGAPHMMTASRYDCPMRGVDLSGVAHLAYDGFAATARWAIGASYANQIEIAYDDGTVVVDRAFSKPADLATTIRITDSMGLDAGSIAVPPDDQIAQMFAALIAAMAQPDQWPAYRQRAQDIAALVDAVRAA